MSEENWDDGEDTPYAGTGNVYRWFRKNEDFVREWRAKRFPSWDTVAARIARDGIVGAKGHPPAGHSVRRVWQRVCRDVKAENAARLAAEEVTAARRHEMSTGNPRETVNPRICR